MIDVKLNSVNGIEFEGGDFATGESTRQHQQLLILSNKGDWKQRPTVGIGIYSFYKEDNIGGFLAEVKQELEKDGMRVKDIKYQQTELVIIAEYE